MNISNPTNIVPVEVASNIRSIQITNLTSGDTYYFTVTAINQTGTQVVSNDSDDITLLSHPVTPNISSSNITVGDKFIRIRWTQPSVDITSYRIKITRGTSTRYNELITATDRIGQSLDYDKIFGDLINGAPYTVAISAINIAGSSPFRTLTNIRPVSTPGQPTISSVVLNGNSVVVSWSAPTNSGGLRIINYTVKTYQNDIEVVDKRITTASSTNTTSAPRTATITGITINRNYTFSVLAKNEIGDSPESDKVSLIIPETRPEKPTITSAVLNTTNNSVLLSWTAPNDGGSSIINYTIKTYQNNIEVEEKRITIPPSPPTEATIDGITIDGNYTFSVLATNIINDSDESDKIAPTESFINVNEPFWNVSQTRTGNSRTSKLPTGVYSSNNMSIYATVRKY